MRSYPTIFRYIDNRRRLWALRAGNLKEWAWLKPEREAPVEFTEWTPDGHLRHSSFAGLRDEKDPRPDRAGISLAERIPMDRHYFAAVICID